MFHCNNAQDLIHKVYHALLQAYHLFSNETSQLEMTMLQTTNDDCGIYDLTPFFALSLWQASARDRGRCIIHL